MDTEPEYKMTEAQALATKEKEALATLLTEGLNDIPSLIREVSKQALSDPGPDGSDFAWTLWGAVFEAAGQASSDEQIASLVEFLVQLSKTDLKDPVTGEGRLCNRHALWKGLPTFSWVIREWFNFDASAVEGEVLARLERQVKLVTLWMAYPDDDSNDLSMFALWALRETFEKDRPVASSAVRLAAPWVLHVAKTLWRRTELGTDMPGRCGVPGDKYADKEWKGFNKERWAVWRDGFVAAQAELKNEEVKALAGRAAEIMKELEG